jgi:ABC-type lipoprotein export system ATPase subunit
MVTHDSQVAAHTERMLLLKDGKILKEKQGLLMAKKLTSQPPTQNDNAQTANGKP